MANMLLTTRGTAGDVFPMLQIGSALKARGHKVTLITSSYYAGLAAQVGIEFAALDSAEEFQRFTEDLSLLHTPQGQIAFFQQHTLPKVLIEYELIRARYIAGETVLVAYHLYGIAAQIAAEKLGIPIVRLFTAVGQLTGIPFLEEFCSSALAGYINQIRATIGLPPVHDWHAWLRYPQQSIAAWPAWYAAPDASWPLNAVPIGFLMLDEAETGDLPAELQHILEHDEPPILITGGTGTFLKSEFYAVGAEACRLLDRPGVLAAQYPQLVPRSLPDRVTWFRHLPFASVMPRMAAVIHHGGTGTLARALSAGIPQLLLAAGTDRPDSAIRLQHLGIAEYLPLSQWRPDLVAAALRRLLGSPSVRERCGELSRWLHEGDPEGSGCAVIESLIPGEGARTQLDSAPQHDSRATPVGASEQDSGKGNLIERADTLSPERRALLALRLKKKLDDSQA